MEMRKVAPPGEDRRWKIIAGNMRRNGYDASALIETLHVVQESFGHISPEALKYVSDSLNIPPSKAFGVATFYHLFNLEPPGEHVISVCNGTSCHVKGSAEIVRFIEEEYGLQVGETTPDGKLTFSEARCVGACSLAPVVILDGAVIGKLGIEAMKTRIREWMKHDG